jgi:hypothetical protein
VLLAGFRQENPDGAVKTQSDAGFELTVDVSKRTSVEALVQKATFFAEVFDGFMFQVGPPEGVRIPPQGFRRWAVV